MPKRVFFSFHYEPDNSRAALVRNIGAIEGSRVASDNDWESVKRGGDPAIRRWIDEQLTGTSCAVVLIGAQTAGRKWINYEIEEAWRRGKGILGVHIHNLKDLAQRQTTKGSSPFRDIVVGQHRLGSMVKVYDPPATDSKQVYAHIATNLTAWIDAAVLQRTLV